MRNVGLLCLPGLGLDAEDWAPTLKVLRTGSPSVPAFPGYGLPAGRDDRLEPAELAGALVDKLADASDPLVVLGHSASCQVAAHLAALAPERVAGLVLVGPTTDPRARSWPRLAARWLATARHETPRQVPALLRQYRRTTLRTMARAMKAARREDILETLTRTDVPVLVLRGRHDRICPDAWAESVASRGGANSRAVTLRAGGHMVPLTDGSLVAEQISIFLAEVRR